eukprot:2518814-Prymnesium_polylepis.2
MTLTVRIRITSAHAWGRSSGAMSDEGRRGSSTTPRVPPSPLGISKICCTSKREPSVDASATASPLAASQRAHSGAAHER